MKVTKIILSMALALAAGLASCSDDFTEPPVPQPKGGSIGTGVWDSPMTAWQVYQLTENPEYPGTTWAYGYIVGVIDTSSGSFTLNDVTGVFEAPFNVASNLCITWLEPEAFRALDPAEKYKYCATVQLASGTAARNALNLSDNPDNQYKLVCVQGETGSNYMGAGAVRSVIDYNWGDKGKQPVETAIPAPVGPFYQNFQKYGAFADYAALGWSNSIDEGRFVGWVTSSYHGNTYMAVDASLAAVSGGPYAASLLSPAVDMDKVEKKTLAFDVQVANQDKHSSLSVYAVRRLSDPSPENVNGIWSAPVKLEAAIPEGPESGFGDWTEVKGIDISSLSGVVRFIWKYETAKGGMNNCATYCVDNVNVGDQPAPVIVDFGTDEIASMLNSSTMAEGWTFDNVKLGAGISYVWKWNENGYLNASAFASGSARESEAYAISPVVSLKGYTGCNVVFEQAAKFQTTLRELCRLVVREAGTTEWTEVEIPYWPEAGGWNFKSSGQCDLSPWDGKDVEIGFKYGSDTTGADTWEIKNLQVLGKK